jgi:hypothetical protein
MHFEEYLERLKQHFSPADFRVPYLDASSILHKIEKKFIRVKDLREDFHLLAQHCSHWAANMKGKVALGQVQLEAADAWLGSLDPATNYWMVLAYRRHPSIKHTVFDTKPNALAALLARHRDDFFIADKHYAWLVYIEVDDEGKTGKLFKCGNAITPFER